MLEICKGYKNRIVALVAIDEGGAEGDFVGMGGFFDSMGLCWHEVNLPGTQFVDVPDKEFHLNRDMTIMNGKRYCVKVQTYSNSWARIEG